MDKNELYRLMLQKEKEFERNKLKRSILTIFVYAAVFFVVCLLAEGVEDAPLQEILGNALFCLFISGVFFVVNSAVLGHLFSKSRNEYEFIKDLKIQIDEMDTKA